MDGNHGNPGRHGSRLGASWFEPGRAPSGDPISVFVRVMPFKLVNQIYLFRMKVFRIQMMTKQGCQSPISRDAQDSHEQS
jgi:hypothetical protein